jgi:arsenite transporter
MTAQTLSPDHSQPKRAIGFFERYLTIWVGLCIVAGIQSGAALATVVGVLIEVPVMLAVVSVVNRSKSWYEAGLREA